MDRSGRGTGAGAELSRCSGPIDAETVPVSRMLFILLAALLIWQFFFRHEVVELGPGVLAADGPVQASLDSADSFELEGYRITPLAEFRIRAKVLSRETYSMGNESDLSPIDLALGWGRMSDEEVLQDIAISQSGRWYRWRTQSPPIPRREIETHSANMHIIPADENTEDLIGDIRQGQIIDLSGLLVRADADDGWHWVSSLTRDDTGARSCELFYVKRVRTIY